MEEFKETLLYGRPQIVAMLGDLAKTENPDEFINAFVTTLCGDQYDSSNHTENFRLLCNVLNKRGYVSLDNSKIKTFSYPLRNKKQSKATDISNLDEFEGMDTVFFLAAHLHFLLTLYLSKAHPDDLNEDEWKDIFLTREVLVVVNALSVKRHYDRLCSPVFQKEINDAGLMTLVNKMLAEFKTLALNGNFDVGDTLSLPCGIPGHCIYVNVVVLGKSDVLLRIDNNGLGCEHHGLKDNQSPSYLLGKVSFNDLTQFSWVDYFAQLCKLKFQVTAPKNAIKKIYLGGKEQAEKQRSEMAEFGVFDSAKTDNCFYENYYIGIKCRIRNRVHSLDEFEIADFMLKQFKLFLVSDFSKKREKSSYATLFENDMKKLRAKKQFGREKKEEGQEKQRRIKEFTEVFDAGNVTLEGIPPNMNSEIVKMLSGLTKAGVDALQNEKRSKMIMALHDKRPDTVIKVGAEKTEMVTKGGGVLYKFAKEKPRVEEYTLKKHPIGEVPSGLDKKELSTLVNVTQGVPLPPSELSKMSSDNPPRKVTEELGLIGRVVKTVDQGNSNVPRPVEDRKQKK